MSETWARKLYAISKLPQEVKDLVKHGKLSASNAYLLTFLDDPQLQVQVANEAAQWSYTVEQMKARIAQLKSEEYEPEPGSWTFDESGRPVEVPIFCAICGKKTREDRQYVWLCPQCLEILHAFAEEWRRQEEAASTTAETPTTAEPSTPVETTTTQVEEKKTEEEKKDWWPY